MFTIEEIVDYYKNLLIIQYNNKPRFRDMIGVLVTELIANNLASQIRDGFNIDTAVGVQLDIIGKYVGIDRRFSGQAFTGEHFAMLEYSNLTASAIQTGFSDYTDFETKDGKWLKYSDIVGGGQILSDDDYRVILKLKIVQNNINHSHKEIDESLFSFFADSVRADSTGNMEMIYFIPATASLIVDVAKEKGVLPRPMGVGLTYLIEADTKLFGFATYEGQSAFTQGFATYADFDTKQGEMLTYNKLMEA
tara:strand:- start:572 stop:1321 length:750 start_codon:yes stop_codon:yes gene_type:complete